MNYQRYYGAYSPDGCEGWVWLESGSDGYATRMVVAYDDGRRCKYDEQRSSDSLGMLPDKPVWPPPDEGTDIETVVISKEEFEREWEKQ